MQVVIWLISNNIITPYKHFIFIFIRTGINNWNERWSMFVFPQFEHATLLLKHKLAAGFKYRHTHDTNGVLHIGLSYKYIYLPSLNSTIEPFFIHFTCLRVLNLTNVLYSNEPKYSFYRVRLKFTVSINIWYQYSYTTYSDSFQPILEIVRLFSNK